MDSSIEQIKDKLSIVDVVGGYVQLQRAGRNFRARCPFHREKTPSFMVSPERGTYMCFGCGERGDIFSFVEKMDGIDFATALRQLAERAGVVLERQPHPEHTREHKEKEEKLQEVCEAATVFFVEELKKRKDILEYLRVRGLHDETIASWRIGYAPASWRQLLEHLLSAGFSKTEIIDAGLAAKLEKKTGEEERVYDRFRGRIMFPISDLTGRTIAFSGRFFEKVAGSREEGEPAKYVNSPETPIFKKSKTLYGLDRAKGFIRKADCILLVEGQFDLVLSHQSGLPFAVALSGTALTPEHLSLLSRFSKRLVLALDADQAGIRAGLRSAQLAYVAGFDIKIPTFAGAKDPADVAKENPELLRAAVRTSQTAIEFFLEVLKGGSRDARAYKKEIEVHVLPLVAALGSKIEQEHFMEIVAQKLGVSTEAVRAEVAKKPLVSLEHESEESVQMHQTELVPLERAAGMLMFYFTADESLQTKLKNLLGNSRYEHIHTTCLPEAERLQFEFESFEGEKEATTQAIFDSIERSVLEDQMKEVSEKLRLGVPQEEAGLLKRLAELKKRQQDLRV